MGGKEGTIQGHSFLAGERELRRWMWAPLSKIAWEGVYCLLVEGSFYPLWALHPPHGGSPRLDDPKHRRAFGCPAPSVQAGQ